MKETFRLLLKTPIQITVFIGGFLCVAASFTKVSIGEKTAVDVPVAPSGFTWVLFSIGCLLLVVSLVVLIIDKLKFRAQGKVDWSKGASFTFENTKVSICQGRIDEIKNIDKDTAIVLPTNTSFVDECITDQKSATGSYFLKYHANKINGNGLQADIEACLNGKTDDGYYPPSTTILLPEKYNTPAKCILTATTAKLEREPFKTEPGVISKAIRKVFEVAANNRLDTLYMPIIGSGRGGMDINDALLFIILSVKFYAKQFHTIKRVTILFVDADKDKLTLNSSNFQNSIK